MITTKQLEILLIIEKGNKDGEPCTVYDIIDELTYETTRDQVLHIIGRMAKQGWVERLGRERRNIKGTNTIFGLGPNANEVIQFTINPSRYILAGWVIL